MVFPLSAWVVMVNMTLQTIGKGTPASILSISRQGLFFLPAILTLPRLWGITGVLVCQSVADTCSFLVAIWLGIDMLKEFKARLRKQEKKMQFKECTKGITG